MLGFSLQKLLLLGLIVFVVWKAFNYIQKRQELQAEAERDRLREERRAAAGRGYDTGSGPIEDMVRCPSCGAYVPAQGMADCRGSGNHAA